MTHSRRSFLQLTAAGAVGLMPAITACHKLAGPSPRNEFLNAAARGDLATVERMLATDPSLLKTTDAAGRSAFALAHLAGHPPVGDHLVAEGYLSDVHEAALARDWERFSALTEEDPSKVDLDHPVGGSAMVAGALGGAGSDIWRVYAATGHPNVLTGEVSALQAALRYSDLSTAEMTAATLLGNDADPNLRGNADAAPLHLAAERGSTEILEMLIRLGADVDARDRRGRTALEVATSDAAVAMLTDHEKILRTRRTSRTAYDVNGRPYDAPDISGIPLVERRKFVGESHRNLDYVKRATAGDPRLVHAVATTGEICVEACAHTGRLNVVDFLLEHGAPYSMPTAVVRGDMERVEALLDEDPLRIHERGAHDFALLWYAVIGGGNVEMMQRLLDRGAEVERQHYLGTTALHWASIRGPIEMVELLIERGADVNRRGRKFSAVPASPLDLARKNDRSEIARLLIDRGARA